MAQVALENVSKHYDTEPALRDASVTPPPPNSDCP